MQQTVQQGQETRQMFLQYLQSQQQNTQLHQPDPLARLAFNFGKGVSKRYDGSVNPEKMEEYFRDMEKNFINVNVPDQHKVRLATHYLERDADKWWQIARDDAVLRPGFDWSMFKEMMEERFFPQALKDRKETEFLAHRQGGMSVQAYTDAYNRLAHFAPDVVHNDRQRVKFYKKGLSAKLQHEIREETTFAKTYSRALASEFDFEAIRREDAVEDCRPAKRAFTPSASEDHAQKRGKQVSHSGGQKNDQGKRSELCWKCQKPYHSGKNCDGSPLGCFICKEAGHFARNCPSKNVTPTSVVPPKPKGKIYVMSRADAEAHPEYFTGMYRVSNVPVIFFLITGAFPFNLSPSPIF
jgi:hypothetical protein